jgi:hypothetical protein
MTYAAQQIKITWGFAIVGTDEIADTSLSFSGDIGWTEAAATLAQLDTAGTADDLFDPMVTMLASLRWAANSQHKSVKLAAVGVDGHYLVDPVVSEAVSPSQGSTEEVPAQCTCVLSLRSGFTLGGGNYGRMYIPHTKMHQETGKALASVAEADAVAAVFKTFI